MDSHKNNQQDDALLELLITAHTPDHTSVYYTSTYNSYLWSQLVTTMSYDYSSRKYTFTLASNPAGTARFEATLSLMLLALI